MPSRPTHRYITCVICRCRVNSKNPEKRKFLAKFPLDEARCRQWVQIIGNEDLAYVPIEKLHQIKYVCGDHFQSKDFNKKKNRLRKRAVPSLLIKAQPLPDHVLAEFPFHISKSDPEPKEISISFEIAPLVKRPTVEGDPVQSDHDYLQPHNKNQDCPDTIIPPALPDHDYCLPSTSGKKLHRPESTSTACKAPTPATPAPVPSKPKPLQSARPKQVDPLALDVKSELEDSDTETHCTEEPVYDETIEEHVTAPPVADKPGSVNNTDANPVTPSLKGVLTTSDAVNIAPQTQAVTSQPRAPLTCHKEPSQVLHQVVSKEIESINGPPMKLTKFTLPLSVLQRLTLDNKLFLQPAEQQSNSTSSLMNLPHEIEEKRLFTELEQCKKENLALRKELQTLQKRNKLLENRLTKLKLIRNDKKAMFDKLTAHMSAPAKALFEMQFQTKKKTRGRRYSLPGRIIALSIYKASPACYALLSKYFVLPSVRVLQGIVASAMTQAATTETNVTKETNPNEPKNEEDQDMFLDENKINGIEDLDLNDYNIDNTFKQEINETSEAVNHIVNDIQAINKEPQSSQAAGDMHQMTDGTSEVQTVELCEGQALQLADGRIFQLIDRQMVEVVGEHKHEELNVPCDETRGTGSSDELKPTVSDPRNTQECDQDAIMVKPLWRYGSARYRQALLSETALHQNNVTNTRQTIMGHYQRSHRPSHRDRTRHSTAMKPKAFDGRPGNVDELCISNPLRFQVGEQATQIKHPHRTQQQHTKHQQTTKESSSYTDLSRMFTRPVTSLKRVATDKEPITSPMSATQLNRMQQCYRKHFKTKETTSRGPDMPDLTFS